MLSSEFQGALSVHDSLRAMTLGQGRQRRINQKIGRAIIKQTRLNVRRSSDTSGHGFEARKKRRRLKGRMLSGFVRGRNIKQRVTPSQTTVSFANANMAKAAYAHQYGHKQRVTRQQQASKAAAWRDKPATPAQASRMNRLGFRVERKGGRKQRVSQKWIRQHLTRWQALGILRDLEDPKPKAQSWETKLPARAFFANDEAWVRRLTFNIVKAELGD